MLLTQLEATPILDESIYLPEGLFLYGSGAPEYQFVSNITFADLNNYAQNGWQIISTETVAANKFTGILGRNLEYIVNIKSNINEELVSDSESGLSFYIDKTINYGDILVITFLSIFLILSVVNFIVRFFIPKFTKFLK